MLEIVAIVAAILVLAIAVVLIMAATKPDVFRVQREALIKAPPDKVFPFINDFRQWSSWSPYENKDPAMKRTYGSTTAGKGAVYEWDGNSNVGGDEAMQEFITRVNNARRTIPVYTVGVGEFRQPASIRIEDILAPEVVAPHPVVDERVRQDAARVEHQQLEQLVLRPGQLHELLADRHAVTGGVEP